jgi:hypothetical protein
MMRYLFYKLYRDGNSGLSNIIMSAELGVVLAKLTDRVLVLGGNISPPANVVRYGSKVLGSRPSRVTDLLDLGVPWVEEGMVDRSNFAPLELCDLPVWNCVFRYPAALSTTSDDFRAFAGKRTTFLSAGPELASVPALSFSGGAKAETLSFYSYLFYLDREAQRLADEALSQTRAKPELEAFANRIANELGTFNCVHVRRGDFKRTMGVTTGIRRPEEALAAFDEHFRRDDLLVILTDEIADPFFEPIRRAYPNHLFIDHYILDRHGQEFLDLPAHDSLALAYLSQLVASHSQDFIGTMTSTFTGLIQRMRGKRGKPEPFKYLWNELPDTGAKVEPGMHAPSNSIRLDRGVMVPERDDPYSWNRYNQRLNPAWMREWPESFDVPDAAVRKRSYKTTAAVPAQRPDPAMARHSFNLAFRESVICVSSNDIQAFHSMKGLFGSLQAGKDLPADTEVALDIVQDRAFIRVDGRDASKNLRGAVALRACYRQVVCELMERYPRLFWLHAGAVSRPEGAIIIPGDWAHGKSSLVLALIKAEFDFLSDDVVPIDTDTLMAWPFPVTPQVRIRPEKAATREQIGGAPKKAVSVDASKLAPTPRRLASFVFPRYQARARASMRPLSPGRTVGLLVESCLSFVSNEDAVIARMCSIADGLPAQELVYSDVAEAAALVAQSFNANLNALTKAS